MRHDHPKEAELLANYNAKLDYYSPASPKELTRLMLAVDAPVSGHMLDVGCGDGRAYHYAYKHTMTYVGIDYSAARISKARETQGQIPNNPNVPSFMCADLYEALENINPGYNLVFCCELLEHLEEPTRVWEEMKRIATEMVVCTTPVDMPHQNHLQVFKDDAAIHEAFPGIATLTRMKFKTPGGHDREHFVFTA